MLRALFAAALLSAGGCNWLSLARNATAYQTLQPGDAGNVVANDSLAYVTLGDSGVAVVDAQSGVRIAVVAPPAGMESVDDLSASGQQLFVLDARRPGHVGVMSLRDGRHPVPVGRPREVAVGPFSGVSAANGVVIVSGGTSPLSVWTCDSAGTLEGPTTTADFGRGQPDVLLSSAGLLIVSAHYWGPYFGVDVARLNGGTIIRLGKLELDGAGFTTGGARPANFPMDAAQLDDSTFVLAFARGLARIRLGQEDAPRLDGVVNVGGPAVNVDALGDVAAVAVAGRAPAIVLLHLASDWRLLRRTALAPGTIPAGVALTSRSVIVAARRQGVLAFTR